jgi:XrtJ-associated TM-motif-TM protein
LDCYRDEVTCASPKVIFWDADLGTQHEAYDQEETMNARKAALALGFALMAAIAVPLRAQTGCDDSPEDPTVVLALVGGAGALAAWAWRGTRARARGGEGEGTGY